jgi:hypothetical protein
MGRTSFEVAQAIGRFGAGFVRQCDPNTFTMRTLDALSKCRTAALGGHRDVCDSCGEERFSYNSCRNRHCPKCQATRQAIWAEDRMREALDVKYFHVVFTLPEELNDVCLLDSRRFYGTLFACVWETLRTFGYSHYGVETGAICVLHTWGQTLALHPHVHCIVPAAGLSLDGRLKRITKDGDFLYPVKELSKVFRGKILERVKRQLRKGGRLESFQTMLDKLWKKDWVVYCRPPLGNVQQIVQYLGRYSHRVAIDNSRILDIDDSGVTFSYKDYKDGDKKKTMTLSGTEFLRRFAMHILPYRFVKIRYYGILGSRQKKAVKPLLARNRKTKEEAKAHALETRMERIIRLTGFDPCLCPSCKKGNMHAVETLPPIRAPSVLFANHKTYL